MVVVTLIIRSGMGFTFSLSSRCTAYESSHDFKIGLHGFNGVMNRTRNIVTYSLTMNQITYPSFKTKNLKFITVIKLKSFLFMHFDVAEGLLGHSELYATNNKLSVLP